MARCPSCSRAVPDGNLFCGSCGSPVETPTSAPTKTSPLPTSHLQLDKARFIPGTVLAGRYRVIALLGRGGMGEVYRADDLKLGQPVALKFLPSAVEKDRARLDRFLNEVRTARQVAHPNVCRVYDIGEVDGHHFLSMEYVDGEDLASLLRQIGRLPQEKATQIARQLCAGLAAAHDQGILHRDLKPANVMLDGRGRARITDFGLAVLAEAIRPDDVAAGTPAYMAPEQLAGKEVTVQSDLYSLGLVLYELFTGKRAFKATTRAELRRLQEESTPTSPSDHVEGLDPSVERMIVRCLERDPAGRPGSALAVAAALPGGDPLAAVLAAGETPSPEMVAAAGPRRGMPPGWAAACLALVFGGILLGAINGPRSFYGRASLTRSCAALEENARTIARDLGYEDASVDHASWFSIDLTEWLYRARTDQLPPSDSDPATRMVRFFYRQSPRPLSPSSLSGNVNPHDPPRNTPGELYLFMDVQGRMLFMEAVSPYADFSDGMAADVDWSIAFRAAGLRMEDFEPASPTRLPRVYATERRAWAGESSSFGGLPVRIEAAAYNGKTVYFEIVMPWDSYWSAETLAGGDMNLLESSFSAAIIALLVVGFVVAVTVITLALRHLRAGRSDRRGATRIAVAMGSASLLHWLLTGHHVAGLEELELILVGLGSALILAFLMWLFYIALEPYIRRYWPGAIISWSRLLAGRMRDPLVGRDVLIGFAGGAALGFTVPVLWWAGRLGLLPPIHPAQVAAALQEGRFVLGQSPRVLLWTLPEALVLLVVLLLLHLVLRRRWLAAGAYCLVVGCIQGLQYAALAGDRNAAAVMSIGILLGSAREVVHVVLLLRFGLLAMLAGFICIGLITFHPLTIDTSTPYFGAGVFGAVVVAAIAVYAYRISLTGRPELD